jgi:hypothetical protein
MNNDKLMNRHGWRKSSHSDSSGNCVEVRAARRHVGVRDSKQDGTGPDLDFAATEWRSFLTAVKNGKLDL